MIIKNKKGQSLIEYTMLVIIVIAAFLTTANYFKRGLQGKWKQTIDDMGDQYDPRYANSNVVHRLTSDSTTQIFSTPVQDINGDAVGYWTQRNDESSSKTTTTGTFVIDPQ